MSTMPMSGILATARTNLQNQLNTVRTNIQSTRTQVLGSRQTGTSSILAQLRTRRQGMSALPSFGGQQGTVGVMARAQGVRAGIQAQGGLIPYIKSKTTGGQTTTTPTVTTVTPITSALTTRNVSGFVIK